MHVSEVEDSFLVERRVPLRHSLQALHTSLENKVVDAQFAAARGGQRFVGLCAQLQQSGGIQVHGQVEVGSGCLAFHHPLSDNTAHWTERNEFRLSFRQGAYWNWA